jgi:hypothetical protein
MTPERPQIRIDVGGGYIAARDPPLAFHLLALSLQALYILVGYCHDAYIRFHG